MSRPSTRHIDYEIPDMECHLRGLLDQVPAGSVTTCGALAGSLGNAIAARWVGHFSLHHDHVQGCPCHRIIRAGGLLGGYIGGNERAKTRRLRAEGVEVRQGVVDLAKYEHTGFESERPLERLARVQEAVLKQVTIRPRRRIPRCVGGVDVSYPSSQVGVAAYALVDVKTGELVYSTTIRREIRFPYITTYLAFREMPILLELLGKVREANRLSSVLLVDGSGILHHRHAGVASHVGVMASLPTVGVTKKRLFGEVDTEGMEPLVSRPILDADNLVGTALRPTSGSSRPLFISPGHRTDVAYSDRLVRHVLIGRRLPEPIYWADRLSRKP